MRAALQIGGKMAGRTTEGPGVGRGDVRPERSGPKKSSSLQKGRSATEQLGKARATPACRAQL